MSGVQDSAPTPMSDESNLVRALRARDPAETERFVRSQSPRALSLARRFLRNEEDAREVVQEAFLSFFRSLDEFRGQAALSTWLHRIVVNSALMRRRRASNRLERQIDDLLPKFDETGHRLSVGPAWAISADEQLATQELRDIVRRRIEELPESYRIVLILRDIEQLDSEVVAEMLETTPNALKTRLHRARQALRTLLEEEPSICPRN